MEVQPVKEQPGLLEQKVGQKTGERVEKGGRETK